VNEVPWIWTGPITRFGPNNLDPQPSKVFFTIGNRWLNLWPAHNRHLITGELFEAIKIKNELEMLQYSTLWPWASVVKVPCTHSIPFPIIWTTLHWTRLISWVVTFESWTIGLMDLLLKPLLSFTTQNLFSKLWKKLCL
jgi:hypothetical protein